MFTSISVLAVAAFANLSACSFPLMPMWLGSHTKFTFFLYVVIRPVTSSSRLGLEILLPDAIACKELYESLNIVMSASQLLLIHSRANFIAKSSAANIVTLSLSLVWSSICNSGMQNAAEVLLPMVLDASV